MGVDEWRKAQDEVARLGGGIARFPEILPDEEFISRPAPQAQRSWIWPFLLGMLVGAILSGLL